MMSEFKLVHAEMGTPIVKNQMVEDTRETSCIVRDIYPPGHLSGGQNGMVLLEFKGQPARLFYPAVIRAKFVEILPDVKPSEIRGTRTFERDLAREKGYDDE
jgi:hypothetical protein